MTESNHTTAREDIGYVDFRKPGAEEIKAAQTRPEREKIRIEYVRGVMKEKIVTVQRQYVQGVIDRGFAKVIG